MDDKLKQKFYETLAPKGGPELDSFDAGFLQKDMKQVEAEQLELSSVEYSKEQVDQAIVHSRQDMVLIYSMTTSNNKLFHAINGQLAALNKKLTCLIIVILLLPVLVFLFIL